jgi:hypothetical protein
VASRSDLVAVEDVCGWSSRSASFSFIKCRPCITPNIPAPWTPALHPSMLVNGRSLQT